MAPEAWWAGLSPGERRLICTVMGLLRGAKRSQLQDVARAAAKWERGIGCFIKVRLMGQAARANARRTGRGSNKITASPSEVRLVVSAPEEAAGPEDGGRRSTEAFKAAPVT